jgi:hypothetical protein
MPDKSGCRTAIDQLRTKLARAKVAHFYYQQKSACYPMRVPKEAHTGVRPTIRRHGEADGKDIDRGKESVEDL